MCGEHLRATGSIEVRGDLLLTLTVNRGHFPGYSYGGRQSKGPFDKK